jgi:hypothetical protein
VRVDAAEREHVERRLSVRAGDVEEAAGRPVPGPDAVEVDGAAVAQERRVADVELVAVRVPAEVGQRVDQQDAGVRAEAVLVPLGGCEAAGAGADDHEVVVVVDVSHVPRVDPGPTIPVAVGG